MIFSCRKCNAYWGWEVAVLLFYLSCCSPFLTHTLLLDTSRSNNFLCNRYYNSFSVTDSLTQRFPTTVSTYSGSHIHFNFYYEFVACGGCCHVAATFPIHTNPALGVCVSSWRLSGGAVVRCGNSLIFLSPWPTSTTLLVGAKIIFFWVASTSASSHTACTTFPF